MARHEGELDIPPVAADDQQATEIARIWAAKGAQHVTMATGLWDDPASWALMLVDLAKHVANSYEQLEGRDREQTLARIRWGFDAEWRRATDKPTGSV